MDKSGWSVRIRKSGDDQITRMELRGKQLRLEGTGSADRVAVQKDGIVRVATLRRLSPDSAGYNVSIPYTHGAVEIAFHHGEEVNTHKVHAFSKQKIRLAKIALIPRFMASLAISTPAIIHWFWRHDHASRIAIRDNLGLQPLNRPLELQEPVFSAEQQPDIGEQPRITVVMPVFNAFDVLPEALQRMRDHADRPITVFLVEDCSTDPKVRPYLMEWIEETNGKGDIKVELIQNRVNLGFVGSANAGMRRALESHVDDNETGVVVLLNSDTLLPQNWASRLSAPILQDSEIASVTPFSNDAELLTSPVISQPYSLLPGMVDEIDLIAAQLDHAVTLQSPAAMPSGVGFCMALNVKYLMKVPAFDESFGAGYGEEVDWSQKVLHLGGRHVACPNLFVEHRGGASFGDEMKLKLLQKNGQEIARRYPEFDQDVQTFIDSDPLLATRLAIGFGVAGAQAKAQGHDPVPVFFAHGMGGGAELDLRRRISMLTTSGQYAVVIRVGGALRWEVELHTPYGVSRGATENAELVRRLVELLPSRQIIYSCAAGDRDPIELPAFLMSLQDPKSGGLVFHLHDYFILSPSYTLLNSKRRYLGVPEAGATDRAHQTTRPDGTKVMLEEWRHSWGEALSVAKRCVAFSDSSARIIKEAYPEIAHKVQVKPHELLVPVEPVRHLAKDSQIVIGVLGNIGDHKGANVVTALAKRLAERRSGRMVVIGNFKPGADPGRNVRIHGAYDAKDISSLAAKYEISAWLIPSIWPETFSFTTHEALATGLPVFTFDLGAQGDAVRAALGDQNIIPIPEGVPDIDALSERLHSAVFL